MTAPAGTGRERLWDLLADEATQGLDGADAAELATLLAEHADVDSESLERAAAACDLALFSPRWADLEPMPAALGARVRASYTPGLSAVTTGRVERDARAVMARSRRAGYGAVPRTGGGPGRVVAWGGWALAAACVALAAAAWWPRVGGPSGGGGGGATLAQVGAFASSHADCRRAAWTAGKDASGAACAGEVVWSPSAQEGYMVFRGLRANDPGAEQYQLWIFDPARDARYPVHGGVFDVPAGAAEAVVPIRPRLGVPGAATFVVTVEQPGGVWVSDRSRIAAVASLK
jgi:hypothetical protein